MERPTMQRKQAQPKNDGKSCLPRRALWAYLLPVLGVVALALLVLVAFAAQFLQVTKERGDREAGRVVAEALAARVGEYLRGRRDLLEVVSRSSSVHKAIEAGDRDRLERTARGLEKLLPGIVQLRIFPRGEIQPDTRGKAPMGFAGVDMVRRALQGKHTPAEIHQITAGKPYLALAVPVMRGEQVSGAAFAAWPMQPLRGMVAAVSDSPGSLWLMQDGADGYVIAATATGRPPAGARAIAVPGGRWSIFYRVPSPGMVDGVFMLSAVAIAALLLVVATLFLRLRALSRDLQSVPKEVETLEEVVGSAGESDNEIGEVRQVATDSDLIEAEPPGGIGMEVEEVRKPSVEAPVNIFRAYDIRGLAEREIDETVATSLGWAFGELASDNGVREVFVAHDPRLSSPALYEALCQGLAEMGMHVIELGMVPAGVLYYAMHTDPDAAAVLVTGSHNPPEYNGFKLYLRTEPVQGEQLQALRARMQEGGFEPRPGSREERRMQEEYLEAITQEVTLGRSLTVVVDGSNGAAGELACALFELLGCEVVPLFCEPDGNFPNHHPDPSRSENLAALRQEVVSRQADLGIAFDGDGDRVGMVDDQGDVVRPEHLLMLLAADILRRHPGSDVIYDVKSSRHLAAFLLSQGGRPILWRSGHSRMKEKMRETGALVGGEFSGHIYIKERWFGNDDAIHVAARLLEVLADDTRPVHEQVAELPHTPATPEYQLPMAEGEPELAMRAIMRMASFPDARLIDLDGLRIEFDDSWGLVRSSNTLPSLTFRFEADNEAALEEVKQRFRELLRLAVPGREPPF